MSGFDRSKFGATSASAIKHQEEVQEELRPQNSNKPKTDYLEISEGENKFRIYPYHPDGGGDTFYEPKVVSFLQIKQQKRDANGKLIEGEYEVKGKPVFNAKVHGLDQNNEPLQIDLVDTYLDLLKKSLSEQYGDDETKFKEKWGIATGYKSKVKIKPQDARMMYAEKWDAKTNEWIFGELKVSTSIKDQMNELASQNEGGDDVPNLDPFSDPDTGICIIIKKDPKAQPADYYKVSFEEQRKPKAGGGFTIELNPTPLSDEKLKKFESVTPLYEKYRDVFTQRDLELEIEGLERFDKENAFGIFDNEEFLEALTYLSENVKSDKPKKSDKKEEEKPKMTREEFGKKVEEMPEYDPEDDNQEAFEPDEHEVEAEEPVSTTTKVETQPSTKSKLDEIRAKLAAGKK